MPQPSLPDFSQVRIVVIGDLMIDEYIFGHSSRVSPEAPVPVLLVSDQKHLPGGAANVGLNLASLGCQTTLLGIYGNDSAGHRLEEHIRAKGITLACAPIDGVRTIIKQRMLAQGQQMLRIDYEHALHDHAHHLCEAFSTHAPHTDIVILSDYGKGTLACAEQIIDIARAHNIRVLIDPKGQDFSRYRRANFITPNWNEFSLVVGECPNEASIADKAYKLIHELQLEGLLVTRGEKGMSLFTAEDMRFDVTTQAREVYDVTGAGDTVIATLGAALGAGASLEHAVQIANHAAGIVVGKSGVACVTPFELQSQLAISDPITGGIVNLQQLSAQCELLRLSGKTIVMTNGCFDLLHAGHITYLQEAQRLGDVLVVLVNSDASVSRLKGSSRPLVPLAERMQVLAALSCVDFVCAFEEDTPKQVIAQLLPDILVKGGDYTDISQIAGAQAVRDNGGTVQCLSLIEGLSTSNIISKAQNSQLL